MPRHIHPDQLPLNFDAPAATTYACPAEAQGDVVSDPVLTGPPRDLEDAVLCFHKYLNTRPSAEQIAARILGMVLVLDRQIPQQIVTKPEHEAIGSLTDRVRALCDYTPDASETSRRERETHYRDRKLNYEPQSKGLVTALYQRLNTYVVEKPAGMSEKERQVVEDWRYLTKKLGELAIEHFEAIGTLADTKPKLDTLKESAETPLAHVIGEGRTVALPQVVIDAGAVRN